MPNWCVNKLYVKGPRADIEAFFRYASGRSPEKDLATRLEGDEPGGDLDFNQFIPYPNTFKQQDAVAEAHIRQHGWSATAPRDGYNSGGYEWCVANWGTKWNASDAYREKNRLRFHTPWGPPEPVIKAMGQRFPTLTFTLKYFERGAGFQGVLKVKGDTVLDSSHDDYHGSLGG